MTCILFLRFGHLSVRIGASFFCVCCRQCRMFFFEAFCCRQASGGHVSMSVFAFVPCNVKHLRTTFVMYVMHIRGPRVWGGGLQFLGSLSATFRFAWTPHPLGPASDRPPSVVSSHRGSCAATRSSNTFLKHHTILVT